MRKDFEFVDFKDYQSDMDELGSQAARVVSALKEDLDREKRDKTRLLAAAVLASGGRVEITNSHLMAAFDAEVTIYRDEFNNTTVIKAKPKASPSQSQIEEPVRATRADQQSEGDA